MTIDNKQNNKITQLSLKDILQFAKFGWRWIAFGAIAGLLSATAFVLVTPPQYEAMGVVRPATFGMIGTKTEPAKVVEVESPGSVLARLKLASFYDESLVKVCQAKTAGALANQLKASIVKDHPLVRIVYLANSPVVAEACLSEIVEKLNKLHAVMAIPLTKKLEDQRNLTKQQLDEVEQTLKQIEKRALTLNPDDPKFVQSILMLEMALLRQDWAMELRKAYNEQAIQLTSPMTQQTKLIEPIFVPEIPVYPKKWLFLLCGFLFGMALGGFGFYLRQSKRIFSK